MRTITIQVTDGNYDWILARVRERNDFLRKIREPETAGFNDTVAMALEQGIIQTKLNGTLKEQKRARRRTIWTAEDVATDMIIEGLEKLERDSRHESTPAED